MKCRSCRHARTIPAEEFKKSLQIPSQSLGVDLSLEAHPRVQELLDEGTLLRCGLRGGIVARTDECEFHSLVVIGTILNGVRTLLTGHDRDTEVRSWLRRQRDDARRRAEEADLADSFERKPVEPVLCPWCHRIHPKCLRCAQARSECGLCSKCGHKVTVRNVIDDDADSNRRVRWEFSCRRCGDRGEGQEPPALPDLGPTGACEACRAQTIQPSAIDAARRGHEEGNQRL